MIVNINILCLYNVIIIFIMVITQGWNTMISPIYFKMIHFKDKDQGRAQWKSTCQA